MKSRYPHNNSIAIDVDGTLITSKGEVNWCIIEFIKRRKNTHIITLWSARGEQYAKDTAHAHSITDMFHHITGKPSMIVDDKGWSWASYSPALHPAQIGTVARGCLSDA